jgi:XTP/dITP diphosphohydrolase
MKLLFASHNENKVKELKSVLPAGIELESLAEIGWQEEVPET